MHSIVKRVHFCYGHRLLDYQGKCARLHGHNGVLEIELAGTSLDPRGMVHDFGDVKSTVREFVDAHLDHRMILRKDDPAVEAIRRIGEQPFLMEVNPTAENIARLIFDQALSMSLPVTAVRLWETPDSGAEYRP